MNKKIKGFMILSLAVMLLAGQMMVGNVAKAQSLPQKSMIVKSMKASQFDSNRLAGADRFETAVAIAKELGAPTGKAIIVNGKNFPDALSAGPLAAINEAPILLAEANAIPSCTLQALKDLKITKVFIIGGTGAISTNIENSIKSMSISTERIAGTDRFDTSVKVADKIKNMIGEPIDVVVTSGMGFADALSIAPIAVSNEMPILLTEANAIPSSVQTYLNNNKTIENTYVVGGTGVISDAVKNKLTNPLRLGGVDRFDTNLKILQHFEDQLYYGVTFLTSGLNYADALAGSVFAGTLGCPLVLTDKTMPTATNNYVGKHISGATRIMAFGGTGVLPDSIIQEVASGISADGLAVGMDVKELKIGYATGDSATSVTNDLKLPTSGRNGSVIIWLSDNPNLISDTGIVTRPATQDTHVGLTAIVLKGDVFHFVFFDLLVKKK